ncbi:MAG: hypothetical protein IPL61_30540 [Myxococcales bacterium]|nr:hypothetical protein [Myxococcales bacterium]
MRTFDTVIVGAGPAGLSAAAELAAHGRCLTVEAGPAAPARDRRDPIDLLAGTGGAGLFSDGKHSFFPSATALWTLPDPARVAAAFAATSALLAEHGVDAGAFPTAPAPPVAVDAWQPKAYPSVYVSLAARFQMIDALARRGGEVVQRARVLDVDRVGDELQLDLAHGARREVIRTRHLVVATGRWSPTTVRPWLEARLGARYSFRRVEFGVRLEAAADSPLFAALPGVDGKLRFIDPARAIEIRTFCTCRQGEVLLGAGDGQRGYSGRADGPPTGRSNVGLMIRTSDPALGAALARAVTGAAPTTFALAEWRRLGPPRLRPLFGDAGAALVDLALRRFTALVPTDAPVQVYGPAIEGVGDYPTDDGALAVAPGVWVAGDATGRFRGIVAAMVSGRYVARRILARAA